MPLYIIHSIKFEDDKAQQDKSNQVIEKFQSQIKTYRKQLDEAEELAMLNIAKFKKTQAELEEAEERANEAEQALQKLRAKNRSSVSMSRPLSSGSAGSRAPSASRGLSSSRNSAGKSVFSMDD